MTGVQTCALPIFVDLLLADVNVRLAEKEVRIELTDKAKKYVIDEGYDPVYGARPLKRYVQKHVETLAARLILEGDMSPRDSIVIDMEHINGEPRLQASVRHA